MKLAYDRGYEGCFVCGKSNEYGLKLDFQYDVKSGEAISRCRFPAHMQGFERVVHGGFISMLLDEAMAKACLHGGKPAVTARIEVRFRKPVFVGEEVEIRGSIVEVRGRKINAQARCADGSGEIRATAEGLFFAAD